MVDREDRYILELKGISKFFPGLKALDRVDFNLRAGEIHAIVGENGAGKSTLIKIITGVYQPDEGDIFYEGNTVIFHNPTVANRYQIAAVYQQPASFPHKCCLRQIGKEALIKLLFLRLLPQQWCNLPFYRRRTLLPPLRL